VPAKRDLLRFYVDESALGVGKALAIAREDLVHVGHPLVLPDLPLGILDPDWIPKVAALGLAVIARDRRIRTKPAEVALLRAHGLRVFWLAGKHDLSNWDKLVRLVRRWDDIETTMATRGKGPSFMAVNESGVTEMSL
jgi:hypothetical protein